MPTVEIATFRVRDLLWGINILQIRENIRNVLPTHVPLTPDYVSGLINLRGQIVTVIDLAWLMEVNSQPTGEESFCIILKNDYELNKTGSISTTDFPIVNIGKDSLGITVDKLEDVIPVDIERIMDSPAQSEKVNEKLIYGVVRLEKELLMLLDLKELLESFGQ